MQKKKILEVFELPISWKKRIECVKCEYDNNADYMIKDSAFICKECAMKKAEKVVVLNIKKSAAKK